MIPSTFLSLHDITGLKAIALQSLDTPLVLRIESGDSTFQISLYLKEADAERVEVLANAINRVMAVAPAEPKAPPSEAAAYKSHDDYMACLLRDLNRNLIHPIEVPK
jgi:hypothetical protein